MVVLDRVVFGNVEVDLLHVAVVVEVHPEIPAHPTRIQQVVTRVSRIEGKLTGFRFGSASTSQGRCRPQISLCTL